MAWRGTIAIVALARRERGKSMEMIDSVLVELPGRASALPGRLLAGLNTGERWRELPRVVVERMWNHLPPVLQATVVNGLIWGMEESAYPRRPPRGGSQRVGSGRHRDCVRERARLSACADS